MDDRHLDLTEAQKAVKSKYPPINKKYECKSEIMVIDLASSALPLLYLWKQWERVF